MRYLGKVRTAVFLCAFASSVAVLHSSAQTPQSAPPEPTLEQRPPQGPTLTITAREVLLDVVVTDRSGHPVKGLTASDFKVTEEGEPQRLASVNEHDAMSAADAARTIPPSLPPNTFTNYTPAPNSNAYTVILLDAMDTPMSAQMYLREQVIAYLKHMQPGTPIAIFQLDSQMRLIQGFSSDPKVLLAAAESKRDMPSLQKPFYGSRELNQLSRNEVLGSGMQMMGRYLAGFPGRKNLIWFTAVLPYWYSVGYTDSSIEDREGHTFHDEFTVLDEGVSGLTDALTLSRVAVYPIDARGLIAPPQFDASRRTPGGGGAFLRGQAFQHMDLDAVADATGGKAYYNTNGLKNVLAEIVENGSNYYTLSYATTNQIWKGQFRRIKIEVDRPGVKLQYRPGYFAIDRTAQEQRQLALLQKRMADARKPYRPAGTTNTEGQNGALVHRPKGGFDAAMDLGAVPPTEIIFTARLAMGDSVVKLSKKTPLPKDNYLIADYKNKPFRTYTLQINSDARGFRVTRDENGVRHGAVQCVTAVYTQDGRMINSLQTTIEFNVGPDPYRRLLQTGLPVKQEIAVPVKGNYFLRIGVHDLTSDHVGALEIPVDEVHAEPGS